MAKGSNHDTTERTGAVTVFMWWCVVCVRVCVYVCVCVFVCVFVCVDVCVGCVMCCLCFFVFLCFFCCFFFFFFFVFFFPCFSFFFLQYHFSNAHVRQNKASSRETSATISTTQTCVF